MAFSDSTIKEFEQSVGKNILEWNREDFIKVLSESNGFTKTYLGKRKSAIRDYLLSVYPEESKGLCKTLASIKHTDLPIFDKLDVYYYYSPAYLYSRLTKTVHLLSQKYGTDEDSYLNEKCAFYFLFEGISIDDIPNIKISDVVDEGSIVIVNGTSHRFCKSMAADIYRFANLVGYIISREGYAAHIGKLVDSIYLFRTLADASMSPESLIRRMRKINDDSVIETTGSIFYPDKIIESGLFFRAYIHEMKTGEKLYALSETNRYKSLDVAACTRLLCGVDNGSVNPLSLQETLIRYHAFKQNLENRFEISKKAGDYREHLMKEFAIDQKVFSYVKNMFDIPE